MPDRSSRLTIIPLPLWFLLAAMLLLPGSGLAQQNPSQDLFESTRPDLLIVVSKTLAGPDTVQVTTVAAKYPQALLLAEVDDLGTQLHAPIRNLVVKPFNPIAGNAQTASLRAEFSVDGLVRRTQSVMGLQEIARAFAEGPGKAPNVLMVQYQTEAPTRKILQSYANTSLRLQAQADPRIGVEYRIKLNTIDQNQIVIPEGKAAEATKPAPAAERSGGKSNLLIVLLIVVSAVAVGALVYSLLLRQSPRPVSK